MFKVLSLILVVALGAGGASAQTPLPAEAQRVEVSASDGLALVADFYPILTDSGQPRPAVLLLHQLSSRRQAWEPLLPALLNAGISVLAVDLRGHGETGGTPDWTQAAADVQVWLDWLRTRPEVRTDAVSIVGASIGANLALIGCASDPRCLTAAALSPGLDYRGVQPESALAALGTRSVLLVAALGDPYSADSVKTLAAAAAGEIGLRLYPGGAHGTGFFGAQASSERVSRLIVDWLIEHTPPDDSA